VNEASETKETARKVLRKTGIRSVVRVCHGEEVRIVRTHVQIKLIKYNCSFSIYFLHFKERKVRSRGFVVCQVSVKLVVWEPRLELAYLTCGTLLFSLHFKQSLGA
jgi:hypothetical protein